MADVLVITDGKRVGAIFDRVCETTASRLRTVPTLAQGEEEIAAAVPSHVFVQSTISGLRGEEVLHLLQRLLPASASVTLLCDDSDPAGHYGGDALDTSQGDAAVEEAIASRLLERSPHVGGPSTGSGRTGGDAVMAAPAETARDLLFASRNHDVGGAGTSGSRTIYYAAAVAGAVVAAAATYLALKAPAPSAEVPIRPAPAVAAPPAPLKQPPPAAPPSPARPVRVESAAAPSAPTVGHLVKKGDTIWKILARYGIGEEEARPLLSEIKRLNNLKELERLQPGQTLAIPLSSPAQNRKH